MTKDDAERLAARARRVGLRGVEVVRVQRPVRVMMWGWDCVCNSDPVGLEAVRRSPRVRSERGMKDRARACGLRSWHDLGAGGDLLGWARENGGNGNDEIEVGRPESRASSDVAEKTEPADDDTCDTGRPGVSPRDRSG